MDQVLKAKYFIPATLFFGFIIRILNLDQSFWLDEAISATVVKNFSIFDIVTKYIRSDTHPPLYYLLLKAWSMLFGYSEISLRMPSVIFGVFTVFIVYKIGSLFSKKVGIIAAVLMATAPLHVYYSQEARMYSMNTFLVSLSVLYFLKEKWKYWGFCIFLIALTDYLPLLILAPFWLHFLLFNKESTRFVNFLIPQIPLFIFLILWFPIFKIQSESTSNYLEIFPAWRSMLGSSSLKDLALVWVKFMIGRVSFENSAFYSLIVFFASVPFLITLYKAISKRKYVLFLWSWWLVPIIMAFVGTYFIPGFSYFRLIFTLPAFYLLTAIGSSKLRFNTLASTVVILLNMIFSSIYLFNSNFWREDWKNVVPFIENRLKGAEIVIVSYKEPFTPYLWYAKDPDKIQIFETGIGTSITSLYTLDYLLDLTDPQRKSYEKLINLGFKEKEVYNFRGVGQVRYWVKK